MTQSLEIEPGPAHIGGRRVLSPLRHHSSTENVIIETFMIQVWIKELFGFLFSQNLSLTAFEAALKHADRVFSTSIYGPSLKHEGHELKCT